MRLDQQAGSIDLLAPLKTAGLPVELCVLPSGDIEIIGRGPEERPMLIGVEYKKIPDVLQCERDGRYAAQLRKMKDRYEVRWLLVEGEWRMGGGGELQVMERRGWQTRAGHTYQEIAAWLLTMTQAAGALYWPTRTEAESVEWLRALYWWWTSKAYEDHRSHLVWYTPPYAPANPFDAEPDVVRKVAAALLSTGPTVDVNMARAAAAATHFGSVPAMLAAGEKAWKCVPGIGAKTAKRVAALLGAESSGGGDGGGVSSGMGVGR